MPEEFKLLSAPTYSADCRTLWLLGCPVSHSLSPLIQNVALEHLGKRLLYLAARVEPENLEVAVRGLLALGAVGANMTVPHKEAAFRLCDTVSQRAKCMGASNVLSFREGRIEGDNTDGAGWLRGLRSQFEVKAERSVLVLGAGGSSRAVIATLLESGFSDLVVLNRSRVRAERLVSDLGDYFPEAASIQVDDLTSFANYLREGLLVVQTTTVGLEGSGYPVPPPSFWPRNAILSELIYGRATPLMELVQELGGETQDGLAMLCCQAAESLSLWLGLDLAEIPLDLMLSAARERLRSKTS